MSRKSIGWVVTIPGAVRAFAMPYLEMLAERYDVTLYVNGRREDMPGLPDSVEVVRLDLRRSISPFADGLATIKLASHFRRRRHVLVHSLLPKSGLVGMIAARMAGVPHRIHLFTGQVWVTRRGFMREILKRIDALIAACTTLSMADSPSQREFLISENVLSDALVLGLGSVAGIDTKKFAPNPLAAGRLRAKLGLHNTSKVIGFLGRINRDKGIPELIEAFANADLGDAVHLVLIGPDEEGLEQVNLVPVSHQNQIHFFGPTDQPSLMMAGMDLFCLPSFREGFGVSVLEASSCGIPVIASRIYGLTDAVVDGETGWLVPAGDIESLASVLKAAMKDEASSRLRGKAGRKRAIQHFNPEFFVESLGNLYHERLGENV